MPGKPDVQIHTLVVTPLEENCYVLWNGDADCVVIDPGGEVERIWAFLSEQKLCPQLILNTHGHIDHIGANAELRDLTRARIGVHGLDAPMLDSAVLCGAQWIGLPYREHKPDFLYADGQTIGSGKLQFEVSHTPGHSPGSCILLNRANRILMGGDLVFAGAVGRWDLPGGNEEVLFQSIADKFLPLADDMQVYPGHGPATTVGAERRSNPFLAPLERLRQARG
ncbi:MAG: MBL fold metallo-hydrolase [Candidatus Sumerlaeaceae bacterium]